MCIQVPTSIDWMCGWEELRRRRWKERRGWDRSEEDGIRGRWMGRERRGRRGMNIGKVRRRKGREEQKKKSII
jgi:hypothetical protein